MKTMFKIFGIVMLITINVLTIKADESSYNIGDTGPGGGKIFYYNAGGFRVYTNADDKAGTICHYLEAAPANQGRNIMWISRGKGTTDIPGTATEIGTGRKNTDIILAADPAAPAALACRNYSGGGKNDWFLPSQEELYELFKSKIVVGTRSAEYYWSSSQLNENFSWEQSFITGTPYFNIKNFSCNVRAIRAF